MKTLLLPIIFTLFYSFGFSQNQHAKSPVKWHTMQEAIELNKTNPKKIFIDIYTDWCGWCKVMDKKTFTDPNISSHLNQHYYPVKFNAEMTDTIEYLGKEYINKGIGRRPTHDLAIHLLNGKLSYPSTLYLDEQLKPISAIPGYLESKKLQPILIFFTENLHLSTPYDKFETYFNKTFTSTEKDTLHTLKWYTIEEATELCKTNPKKILLHLYTDWSLTSKMMMETTYKQATINKYLNDNYYMVKFNATSKDTIHFTGQTFINKSEKHPFHDFAVTLLDGRMSFPTVIYLGADSQIISAVSGYMTPKNTEPILHFFKEEAHKTATWEEYRKNFTSAIKE